MDNKIKITKKGEDGYKIVSLRIKEDLLNQIDGIATETKRSRNEVMNIIIEKALRNIEIE